MESLNLPSILTPDFGLLFWMLVAFVALFLLLAKFGFPAITNAVEARKNFIDESLQNARAANEKLAGIQAESEKVLREAREKQAEILKEAAETNPESGLVNVGHATNLLQDVINKGIELVTAKKEEK